MFVPLTTPYILSPKVVVVLPWGGTSPHLIWAACHAVFASQHMLTCTSLPLQEKVQEKDLLFLAFISILRTPVSLSGGAGQGSKAGTCNRGNAFNAWGAPSSRRLLDVPCSGVVYSLFWRSLFYVSPANGVLWRLLGVVYTATPHGCRRGQEEAMAEGNVGTETRP